MARLTFKAPGSDVPSAKGSGVKRVRSADGSYANTVKSDSHTLSSDLGYVFRSNVKKARKTR